MNEEWIEAYLSGELPPESKLQFEERLATDEELLREYIEQARIHHALDGLLADGDLQQFEDSVMRSLRKKPLHIFEAEVMEKVRLVAATPNPSTSVDPRQIRPNQTSKSPVQRRRAPSFTWLALAAGLALLIGGYFYLTQLQPRVIAELVGADSAVTIQRDTEQFPAPIGTEIQSEDLILTADNGKAVIQYQNEATVLQIGSKSQARLRLSKKSKAVEILAGTVQAEVTHQPAGAPMLFLTPNALATVLGTRLTISYEASATRLEVAKGNVRLSRLNDQLSVDATSGFYAVAGLNDDLKIHPLPSDSINLYEFTREEVDRYLQAVSDNRANSAKSEKAVRLEVVHANADGYGQRPLLLKKADMDPASITNYDPDRLNEAYFQHIDYIIAKALSLKLSVRFISITADAEDALFGSNSLELLEQEKRLGRWLGRRYGNNPAVLSSTNRVYNKGKQSSAILDAFEEGEKEKRSK